MAGYIARQLDATVQELFTQLPAILLVGPRASGKTTTAARHAKSIVRLDREAEAQAFRADPDAALRALQEPVLLDEWQVVPGVLGAVKRMVDTRPDPGRFLTPVLSAPSSTASGGPARVGSHASRCSE